MKHLRWLVGTVALVAGSAGAAPFNAGQVNADAKWVLHLDADRLRETQVGKLLLQRLTTGKDNDKLNALSTLLGTDLRKDLSGATLYGSSDADNDGVVVLSGRFDRQRLITLLKADDSYTEEAYRGATVHSWIDQKKNRRMYGTMLGNDGIILSGNQAATKAALDVMTGQGVSLLRENRNHLTVDTSGQSVVFMAAADLKNLKKAKANAQTLKQAQSASISVLEEGADMVGRLRIEADSADSVQKMSDAVRGILAVIQLSDDTDPKTKAAFQQTLIEGKGNELTVALRMPAEVLVNALEKKMKEDDAKKAAATEAAK